MTITTISPDLRARTRRNGREGPGIGRLLRAEWTKLRTLRSTWITVLVTVGSSVALAHLNARTVAARWPAMDDVERAAVDPANTALVGVVLTTVFLGSLAARGIAVEYSTGMIDATFLASGTRKAVLAAKTLLVVLVAAAVALPTNLASYLIGVATLDAAGVAMPTSTGEAGAAIVAATGAVALFAGLGLGLGALTRRPAAGNIALAVLVLGGQILAAAVPSAVRPYLPSTALEASVSLQPRTGLLEPATALAVLGGYAALVLVAAGWAVRSDR